MATTARSSRTLLRVISFVTLENYREEMWRLRDELPEGWEAQVYSWFNDNGQERHIENSDDRGGWAPREKLIEALEALGLYPQEADQPLIVDVRRESP
jgi:hypothetical protein